MKTFLVIGIGRFGRHLCKKLYDLGYEVMAVDSREECINSVLDYTTDSMIGDSTNETFIRSLGVDSFDTCFVAIGDNFQNSLETTSLLKEAGAKVVVARASREVHRKFLLRNGADKVVYPELEMAEWSAIRYSSEHILDYIPLPGANSIFEVALPGTWIGKSISELHIRKQHNLNIVGIKKDGHLDMIIDPELRLEKGMSLLVIGKDKDIQNCFHISTDRFRSN
jgi:trk system potassium uptake protein TrkA